MRLSGGVCRESSGASLASLELLCCEGASISEAKVSDIGNVTPGVAPEQSDRKVSFIQCIAEPVSHLESVMICNSINHRQLNILVQWQLEFTLIV